jgi:kynurenine formamidase
MVANTGTYLDAPFHRFADGADLAAIPLSRVVDRDGVTVRVDPDATRAIGPDTFEPYHVTGRAVLVHIGWDRHWGSGRYADPAHPFLTAQAASWLAERQPALVGIDSVNIDDTTDGRRPAHTALLGGGVLIVEHLRGLEQLPPTGFRFSAAPPRIEGMGTFPVRAFAVIHGGA